VAAVLFAALLLANGPYLYGLTIRPPGTRFWAVPPINSGDANQYLALTHIASQGALLLGDPFTSEPHRPRLLVPTALFEGLLCRIFGWSPVGAFNASRVLFGAVLLGVAWWFGTVLLRPWRLRWAYLALLGFSAGAGWIVERLGGQVPNGDLFQPEGNTFFSLGNLPHLPLSNALLTALFGTLLALERDRPGRRDHFWLLLTFLCAALLSWTHPFDFMSLGLGLGSYGLIRWVTERSFPLISLMHGATALLGALPAAAYLFWLSRTDPFYQALASDVLQVQPFSYYAIAHGWFVLAALPVLFHAESRRRYLLPICWAACVFLFLATPFRLGGKQPRLIGGIHVPLAILAVAGLDTVSRTLARRKTRAAPPNTPTPQHPNTYRVFRPLAAGFVLLTATGVWGMIERHVAFYGRRGPDFYMSPGVLSVFGHLRNEARWEHLTLGGPYTGGWAPTWVETRVFHGHWHMTLNSPGKASERQWFFTGAATPQMRAWWLRSRAIDWVIWYPWEWNDAAVPLDGTPGLERVLTQPDVVLYRVHRPGTPSGGPAGEG